MFSQVSVCQHGGRGVSVQGWSLSSGGSQSERLLSWGSLSGSLCQGRSLSRGGLCSGVSVQEGLCLGVSVQGDSLSGRSLSRGSLSGRSPCTVTCGRYSSYCDAFFLQCIFSLSYMAFQIEPTKIYWIRYFNFITNK